LEADRLRDLSISRTTFNWGIPVPEGFDSKHVMYVWFDALSNYLTGVNALGVNGDNHSNNLGHHWPADVHIIGKDIIWFHTVIWPCMLMSAGVPLPKTVFCHGFVNDKDGLKMSKSIGNVIDPHDMLDLYPVDSFRWYMCKEAPFGGELSFSEESLLTMHNADLCDTLGNLIHRATNLCMKYCDGNVPDVPAPDAPACDFENILSEFVLKMDNFQLESGAAVAIQGFRDVNGYLTEQAPWKMKGDEFTERRQIVVRATLEAVYALAHLLVPFIPSGAKKIFEKLGTDPIEYSCISGNLRNLKPGTRIQVGEVLYTKIQTEADKLDAAEAAKKKAESYAIAQQRKKEKKAEAIAKSNAGRQNSSEDDDQPEFTKIDIRVGQITKVWLHSDADKLFCEEIDVGEDSGPRQIASGLREHYSLEDMQGKKVLVVCNLKAAKIVGFTSNGMVLAAKSTDGTKVELVSPPSEAKVGERVFIEGLKKGEPQTSAQVKKRKTWEKVVSGLKTIEGGIATWEGQAILTSSGKCAAASLVGATIS
jgi:methionyl-tRNA synthetase